jgi:4-amino-4-deoxy-L-arabinose transferase-like glycosyltransferase
MAGPRSVYWVRFLNVPIYAGLIAAAYAFCRPYFGREIAVAVSALTAFFPNVVFFTINSDILSPLLALMTLMLVVRWCTLEQPGPWLSAGAGLLAAAAILVKLTNAAVLSALGVAILLRLWRDRRPGKVLNESWPMLLCVILPVFLWGLRNLRITGDWTGTSEKIRQLTWTPKPFGELLKHPIFTPQGAFGYLPKLTVSFFDGDSNWHHASAHSAIADKLFIVSSGLVPLIGLAAAFFRGAREPRARLAAAMSALVVSAYLAVLIMLSLRFDFGICAYPSREEPYFTSGRLICGALVPFLALFACGLQTLVGRSRPLVAAAVAATVGVFVLAQEPFLKLAMVSKYNWFHLP